MKIIKHFAQMYAQKIVARFKKKKKEKNFQIATAPLCSSD